MIMTCGGRVSADEIALVLPVLKDKGIQYALEPNRGYVEIRVDATKESYARCLIDYAVGGRDN